MKKCIAVFLCALLLCTAFPVSMASAFDGRYVYSATDQCKLTALSIEQADNTWMIRSVGFTTDASGRVYTTDYEHPNMIGRKVKLCFDYVGDSVSFNGKTVLSQETEVTLNETNTLTVYAGETKAEYQINITETTTGLPIVLLDTNGANILDKVNYVPVSVSVLGGTVDYAGKDIYCATGGIKLRGNSTMGYDKKPYRIKLDKKQSPLDLGKAKSWTLIANFLDESLMRNRISYSFGTRMNAWCGLDVFVPRMRPVEVYLNGEYRGLYDLGDHMQSNEIRVNIKEEFEDTEIDTDPALIGYYFESEYGPRVYQEGHSSELFSNGEDAPYFYITGTGGYASLYNGGNFSFNDLNGETHTTPFGLYYQFKCPDPPTEDQIDYIKMKMDYINTLIQAKDESLWDYLDLDSTINWYLQNEIFRNLDSNYSMYLYKPEATRDEDGHIVETKVYMGPLWDFDIAMGAMDYGSASDPTGWRTRDEEYSNWFDQMFEMPSFKDALVARWNSMKEEGILDSIFTDIDTFYSQIADAADRNHDLWHETYYNSTHGKYMHPSPTLEGLGTTQLQVQYIKSFMHARIEWIDSQLSGYMDLTPQTKTVSGSAGDTITLPINRTIGPRDLPYIYLNVTADNTAYKVRLNMTTLPDSSTGTGSLVGHPAIGEDWYTKAEGVYMIGMTSWFTSAWCPYGGELSTLTNYKMTSIEITFVQAGSLTVNALYACAEETPPDAGTIAADRTLGGTVEIWGDAAYGETLRAGAGGVTPRNLTLSHQWLRDGEAIAGATSTSYTLTAADIGHALSLRVTANGYTGSVTSEALTVSKAANNTVPSAALSLVSKTTSSLTLTNLGSSYEYSLDGESWQTSPVFDGLTPNTAYAACCRIKESSTAQASLSSSVVYFFTDTAPLIKGDTNGDQAIDSRDARLAIRYVLHQTRFYDAELITTDVNGDSRVDSTDVRIILQTALQLGDTV